jgi:hypothetical protein
MVSTYTDPWSANGIVARCPKEECYNIHRKFQISQYWCWSCNVFWGVFFSIYWYSRNGCQSECVTAEGYTAMNYRQQRRWIRKSFQLLLVPEQKRETFIFVFIHFIFFYCMLHFINNAPKFTVPSKVTQNVVTFSQISQVTLQACQEIKNK